MGVKGLPLVLLGLAASTVPLAGCGSVSAWMAGEPPMEEAELMAGAERGLLGRGTWKGEQSRAATAAFIVARTETEWQAVWDLVGQPAPGPLPDRLMALAVFLGTRTSAGYGVDILSVRPDGPGVQRERLLVEYRETAPPPGQVAAQVLTSPYVVVLIDRTAVPARYAKVP